MPARISPKKQPFLDPKNDKIIFPPVNRVKKVSFEKVTEQ